MPLDEFFVRVIEECKGIQKTYSPFITLEDSLTQGKNRGALFGLPVSIKDSICTMGMQTTAGSKILQGYIPPFDATCVARLKEAGATIIGKTAMDEFGFGTFSTTCAYGVPKNPVDIERSCGGSSGGAGCITAAANFPHVAVAQSTGGSITAPAAFTGTVGLTPTYGRVSRYGLIDYSNSMDKIGVISKTVHDAAMVFSVIAGYDALDSTSANVPAQDFAKALGDASGLRIGVPKEYFSESVDRQISKIVLDKAGAFEKQAVKVEAMSLPLTKYAIPAYYLIAMSEASTNLAKFCGLRYGLQEEVKGNYEEYFSAVREHGLGEEAKRRILLGTYARMAGFRDAYYLKALKVRSKIINEFKAAFQKYDVLITPSMPLLPPRFSEIKSMEPIKAYGIDMLTVAPNMAGLPTISVPAGTQNGLPIGMQIIGNYFREDSVFKVAYALEGLK